MSEKGKLLLGPGPSNVDASVLEALSRPVLGHLDPDFLRVLDDVSGRLREVFKTTNRMTFAVSGTGSAGMEAAICNILEPGDPFVVGVNGVFGTRMAEIGRRCGAYVVEVEAPWGRPIEAEAIDRALTSNPAAKAVAIVHAETSTGVAQPIEEIADVVASYNALFVLDTVTSLAGMPVEIDAWAVDVAYSGTQKCLSVPPGLSPITFSDAAIDAVRARKKPPQSWYLDVGLLEGYWGSDRVYHHTAPISMLFALHAGLGVVLREGLKQRFDRHRRAGALLMERLTSRGFNYVAPEGQRLPMLHCVEVPDGVDAAAGRKKLLEKHRIEVGAGIGPFAERCWRIGLMGTNAAEENVERLVRAIDEVGSA